MAASPKPRRQPVRKRRFARASKQSVLHRMAEVDQLPIREARKLLRAHEARTVEEGAGGEVGRMTTARGVALVLFVSLSVACVLWLYVVLR